MYLLKPSFAGGEISPAMYGRTDFAKYDNGAATLKNFMVMRYGGVSNRPGTKYIASLPGRAVLRAFKYNSEQNYMVVFYQNGIQVYKDESLEATITGSPYTADELRLIKCTQSANYMFLVHPEHPPYVLIRGYSSGQITWSLERMDIEGGPFEDGNTTSTMISASGLTGTVTLTATANYFTSDMVGSLLQLGHTVGSQYVKGVPAAWTDDDDVKHAADTLEVSCVPGGSVYVESFGFWKGNFTLEKYIDGSWTKIRTQEGNHSSNYNFTETNNHSSIVKYRITSTEFDPTTWSGENKKQTGNVTLQTFSQDYYGIVKITSVNSTKSATATVIRELGEKKATKDYAISPWSTEKGYPACAKFFEDRLVFAGNQAYGQTFWMSKGGDYFNFSTSVPSADTDAVTGTLNGGEMNGIKAMIAFGELIMLTAGSEYKVTGNNKAISPSNILSQAQEYRGINDVEPVTVGSRIIYIQHQGNIVRDLAYTYEADKYTGDDINLLAQHLFDEHKLVSMAYQQTPNSIVWFVRDDGLLLGLTYLKEQDIYAWHQHETVDGSFYDVATIAGTKEDEVWCVVERDGTYMLEKMAAFNRTDSVEDQFFVDCGKQFESTKGMSTVSGLTHLNGKTVNILADGFVLPQQTVTNGAVDLGHSHKKVIVGLPIESLLVTLPLELNAQDGSTMSRRKRVSKLMLLFKDSSSGTFGLYDDKMDQIKWRSTEPYGQARQLQTGKQELIMPSASFEKTVQVRVKQTDPLPMTILSIVPEIEVGG